MQEMERKNYAMRQHEGSLCTQKQPKIAVLEPQQAYGGLALRLFSLDDSDQVLDFTGKTKTSNIGRRVQ